LGGESSVAGWVGVIFERGDGQGEKDVAGELHQTQSASVVSRVLEFRFTSDSVNQLAQKLHHSSVVISEAGAAVDGDQDIIGTLWLR